MRWIIAALIVVPFFVAGLAAAGASSLGLYRWLGVDESTGLLIGIAVGVIEGPFFTFVGVWVAHKTCAKVYGRNWWWD